MIHFICELEDKNYSFKTTSLVKLMKFILNSGENNNFIITIAADKDVSFIDHIRPTKILKDFYPNVITSKKREYTFKVEPDHEGGSDAFGYLVDSLIQQIACTCCFSHNEAMMDKIDNKEVTFMLLQDIAYDWNFELVIGKGEEPDERIYSATLPMLIDKDWFITIAIFRYITGRPLVLASPDCINMQTKPLPLPDEF